MDYSKKISNTLSAIECNLEYPMTLESLSKDSFFSPYHYHRIFLNEVGTSIMNYVRKRRVFRASYQLLLTEESITNLAYDCGFESVDTFIRVFKRYYGVTPSEYRSNHLKSYNYVQQEVIVMMNQKILDKLKSCTTEDKKQCLVVLEKMINLSRKAHKYGLLFLESEVSSQSHLFLKKGIDLLLGGTKPENLKAVLWNYLNVGDYSSKEILERVIMLNGLLLIQAGDYPWMVREHLSSLFGENFMVEVSDFLGINHTPDQMLNDYRDTVFEQKPFNEQTALLEKEIKSMNARSVQRLVRELDIIVLAYAIEGASGEVKLKFMEGLSKSNQLVLFELKDLLSEISLAHMIDSQNEVLKVIKSLRLSNDLV
jgi:AraC-like DNA-binding protein